jgi:DNA repair exonuclease SbcCD ATPase subunit
MTKNDLYADLKLYEFVAENFKKLRLFRVTPHGPVMQITGPNGAGKTSAVDAIWFLLKGIKGLPVKAVRMGAEQMKVSGRIGNENLEFTVTRTLAAESQNPTLEIKMIKGKRETTPQDFLDQIFDILTFDPLEFIRLDPKAQIAKLRETAHVDLDFDALAEEHDKDYKARAAVNLERKAISARIEAMKTLEGLPFEKLDEGAILVKLNEAGEANRKAQQTFKAKQDLEAKAASARAAIADNERLITSQAAKVEELEEQLKQARQVLKASQNVRKSLATAADEAQAAYEAAPAGDPIDVGALTAELQSAQRTNRAIDEWRAKEELRKELAAKDKEWQTIDERMAAREEKKRKAVAKAKIPVEGLTFNDSMTEVRYNNLPLENLGEGEQIRLSTRIAMAANPKLRVLCIRHGEALDEAGMKILYDMAVDNNFQIWMARVDTSGRVGIVLEDGNVVAENDLVEK